MAEKGQAPYIWIWVLQTRGVFRQDLKGNLTQIYMKWAILEKNKQESGVEYMHFEKSLEFLGFLLYSWKLFRQNKVSPLETP